MVELVAVAVSAILIYSTVGHAVRRVVLPDNDAELGSHISSMHPGESYLTLPHSTLASADFHEVLATHLGVDRTTLVMPRAALIDDSGTVVQVLAADADIDTPLIGHLLVNSLTANIGDKWFITGN